MIGKNEETDNHDVDRIKLIADRRRSLEVNTAQIQAEIKTCFGQLAEALETRKRQLLRQAEAVHTQQLSLIESTLEFLPPSIINLNEKHDLEERIKSFGKIELSGTNCITVKDVEPYKVQEYQEANKDHVSFNKSIKFENVSEKEQAEDGKVICDFAENQENIGCNSTLQDPTACPNSVNINFTPHIKKSTNLPEETKCSEILPTCSPAFVIKQEINSTDLLAQDTSELGTKCSNKITDTNIYKTLIDSVKVDRTDKNNLQTECNNKTSTYIKSELNEINELHNQDILEQSTKEDLKQCEDVLRDSFEHPKQIQQWLQQILVETEIEPIIHDIGQISEISEAQTYNNIQLKT